MCGGVGGVLICPRFRGISRGCVLYINRVSIDTPFMFVANDDALLITLLRKTTDK